MLIPRVIPVLLLRGEGLVKTKQFKDPRYVGDPINAVRIFNEKEVDELIFLDINASKEGRPPNYEMVERIASECFMPLAYGGGVKSLDHANRLFSIGVEKVIINTAALDDSKSLTTIAQRYGSQAVVGAIDFRKPLLGSAKIYDHRSGRDIPVAPSKHAKELEERGAGEIFLNAVERDGMRTGYLLDVIKEVSAAVGLPLIACGGADTISDIRAAIMTGEASAAAAGAMFVFHGKHQAVLITYPKRTEIEDAFS